MSHEEGAGCAWMLWLGFCLGIIALTDHNKILALSITVVATGILATVYANGKDTT